MFYGFPEGLFDKVTGSEVADYDVTVCEGTDLDDADCEVELTLCERVVSDDEGLFAVLFGTLPNVWKRISN